MGHHLNAGTEGDYRNGHLWYNVDSPKWLIYTLSTLGLADGLIRCDSSGRAGMRPRNPTYGDSRDIAGDNVAAANPRLQQKPL